MPDATDSRPYAVVVNDEEQYSIWPQRRDLPAGWRSDGFTGSEEECLAHIEETWTDMRPVSLRRWMDERERGGGS
jgi:MbtH protein